MRRIFSCLAFSMLLIACGDKSQRDPDDVDFRLMTFNIEYGGAHVSFDNVVEAIRRSGADIVGMQEAEGNMQRLAAALAWHYDSRNYVISRFPLYEPPQANGKYVLVEVQPGRVIALANLHLPSDPYGPDMLRDGHSVADVLDVENSLRVPKLLQAIDVLPQLVAASIPTFVTGDFNSPAHTDWTADMLGARHFLNHVVGWPVSLAMVDAGFADAWRAVYPDPKTRPGLTWWAGRPPLEMYAPGENDAQDRIDQIWFAGPAKALASELVGEEDGPGVSISVMPWPSDHRGVVVEFTAKAAPMPALITTDRRVYRKGENIGVRYRLDDRGGDMVLINSTDGTRTNIPRGAETAGEILLPARRVGHFMIGLEGAPQDQHRELWVLERDAAPALDVTGSWFDVGQGIPLRWHDGPGHRNDYIAVYKAGTPAGSDDISAWVYVQARPAGTLVLDGATAEFGWPLPPGQYSARLMLDDGYHALAESARFRIASNETVDLDGEPL